MRLRVAWRRSHARVLLQVHSNYAPLRGAVSTLSTCEQCFELTLKLFNGATLTLRLHKMIHLFSVLLHLAQFLIPSSGLRDSSSLVCLMELMSIPALFQKLKGNKWELWCIKEVGKTCTSPIIALRLLLRHLWSGGSSLANSAMFGLMP